MAEKIGSGKARKSHSLKNSPGNVHISDLTSEDAAKRRAALERTVRHKIETEKRAHQIVERLLENNITTDFLLDCAKFISPSHYKDTVEERSIIKQCGYPICNKKLENVPKQKYKISTRTNKVYDITERKCFCSNFCYRASKYYEAQVPQSPVWSREEESPPVIKLLEEGKSGHTGEEVKLADRRIRPSEIEKPKHVTKDGDFKTSESDAEDIEREQAFVSSVISGSEPSLDSSKPEQENVHNTQQDESPGTGDIKQNVSEIAERINACTINDQERTVDRQRKDSNQVPKETVVNRTENIQSTGSSIVDTADVTQRAVSKSGAEYLRRLISKSRSSTTVKDMIPPVAVKGSMLNILTQTLNEWKSEETLKYLFGNSYVIEPKEEVPIASNQTEDLDEDDISFEAIENTNSSHFNECLPFQNDNNVSKPLPDFAKLKQDTKMMELRVQDFFGGNYVLPENLESGQLEESNSATKKADAPWAPPLPLVDSYSQQQIRRRIVLERLKKVLPAILGPLQITYSDVSKELHNLVKTFRFSNKNINHTTPEWSIIAIVLLSALLPTMPLYKDSQKNPVYTEFISRLLEGLHFQNEDLEFLKKTFDSNTLSSSSV
ncbi:PREDICTED: putative RNA polymerase II subunit B1 CTD phosphatase RPAP2 [Nanorana parkeri]|uniref:putative RNA polymerase II subunit B1 CTD phosphatase RPAP2 n=1 Tax=Nanorana parkeri TaxID=125878 RepID=UPI000854FCDB|nr:PREDICTED: putative RNA polymerase II subunit B1 CTD phosphatase RPAP2 [Nanorana parkeri]